MTWQKIPFVRLLFPFILGVLFYDGLAMDWETTAIGALFGVTTLGLVATQLIKSPSITVVRVWGGLLFGVLFLLGIQWSQYQDVTPFSERLESEGNSQPITYLATINSQPILSAKSLKAEIEVSQFIDSVGEKHPIHTKVLAYFKLDTHSVNLQYGDQLLLQSEIKSIAPPSNPYAFNAKNYYATQRLYLQSYIPSGNWQLLASQKGSYWWEKRIALQDYLQGVIKKYIRGPNEQAVAIALLLGAKSGLSQDIKNAYADTGAMHVLAVSGLHIGIIAGILMALLNLLGITVKKRKKLRTLLLLGILWFFALLTGGSASVLRATTMFSFLIVGQSIGRKINVYNSLAASAFLLLCTDVYLIYNVGFQLSYIALIGIVYYHPKIYKWYYTEHKILDWLWNGIAVSLAAQIATLPISLYYFHQFPVFFWLSGVVVTAMAGLVLGLGIVLLLVQPLPHIGEILGSAIGGVLDWMIWVMNSLIFLIQKIPMAVSEGFWLAEWELYLGYVIIIGMTHAILSRQLRYFFLPLILVLVISSYELGEAYYQCQQHKIIVYDVRKSTCIDIIKGKSVVTVGSTEVLGTPILQYAQQNNHWALGIEKETILGLQKDTFSTSFLHFQYPVMETSNRRLLILNKDLENKESYVPIEVNYVLLCDNPKLESIKQLDDLCTYKTIIIDQSNSYWRVNKWKSQCLKEDIDFIDIGTQGAFSLDID